MAGLGEGVLFQVLKFFSAPWGGGGSKVPTLFYENSTKIKFRAIFNIWLPKIYGSQGPELRASKIEFWAIYSIQLHKI